VHGAGWMKPFPKYETAVALNPNWVFAHVALGACNLLTGDIEEAVPLAEQAIRLSPRAPNIGIMYERIGYVHLLQSRIDETIFWCEKARSANPAHPVYRAHLASAYAIKGDTERAAAELAEAQRLTADGRYSSTAVWWLRNTSGCRRSATYSRALFWLACPGPGSRRNKANSRRRWCGRGLHSLPSARELIARSRCADSLPLRALRFGRRWDHVAAVVPIMLRRSHTRSVEIGPGGMSSSVGRPR
jgi:tetratricopeptide (TPR) repeat protein